MRNRFEAIGPFVYEKGNRIGVTPDEASVELARKLNAYQMRVERFRAEVDRLYRAGDLMLMFACKNMPYPPYVTMAKDWLAVKEDKDQP